MGEKGLFHYNDSGYKVDLSKQQEQLAEKAYIDGFDPENHDEYLVNGAILTCSKAVTDVKVLHGRVYNVKKPSKETVLTVTENPQAKCCGYLYHATVEDRKVEINIPPFRCNCSREPHNDKEWAKLEADESCMEEGTCKALINLHDQWDNLPAENPYLLFWNEDRRGMVQGITKSSMLFCRHGGIITPDESGQIEGIYNLIKLRISGNLIALYNTTLEPASVLRAYMPGKIQGLCVENGIVYFDEYGYQRIRDTGLVSDPYLVALAEYYSSAAVSEGIGDAQGYGAIFKVTLSSGKEIYVTMGDAKDEAHTGESKANEGENFYAGEGNGANTLEFICNYDNRNSDYYSDNMDKEKGNGNDRNWGKGNTIMEGASITDIGLIDGVEIDWEAYFEVD